MTVARLVEEFQKKATYVFRQEEIEKRIQGSHEGIRKALIRLIKKKQILRLHNGLFLIVPLEYQMIGAPPPVWYIDTLMNYLSLPYYIGLLTASSLQGAAHQQPAEFQIMTTKQIRSLRIGRTILKFFNSKQLVNIKIQKMKSETGYFNISSPEITAYDLIKYVKAAGSLHNAATVLAELSNKIDPIQLEKAASLYDFPTLQRVGYLLERFGEKAVTDHLFTFISSKKVRYIPLRPGRSIKNCKKDPRWHLIVNEEVEIDS
jgi:predicted transcriptional regulator of viral defense system